MYAIRVKDEKEYTASYLNVTVKFTLHEPEVAKGFIKK